MWTLYEPLLVDWSGLFLLCWLCFTLGSSNGSLFEWANRYGVGWIMKSDLVCVGWGLVELWNSLEGWSNGGSCFIREVAQVIKCNFKISTTWRYPTFAKCPAAAKGQFKYDVFWILDFSNPFLPFTLFSILITRSLESPLPFKKRTLYLNSQLVFILKMWCDNLPVPNSLFHSKDFLWLISFYCSTSVTLIHDNDLHLILWFLISGKF